MKKALTLFIAISSFIGGHLPEVGKASAVALTAMTISSPANAQCFNSYSLWDDGCRASIAVDYAQDGLNLYPTFYVRDTTCFKFITDTIMATKMPTDNSPTNLVSINSSGQFKKSSISSLGMPIYYNRSGAVSVTKIFTDTITPTTGNGYSVNISAAGFTNIISANATTIFNTSTPTSIHSVEVKSITSSAVVLNIIQQNVTTILGINVLGSTTFIGSGTGTQISLTVIGN